MGGKINKDFFADYNGMRIYFCCGGCDETFRKNPEKYLQEMREKNIAPERLEDLHAH
ncbi:MAG TPA: YHS domain-containing protein [Kiritimatiellia bacterium]|nr:YHS domain-containing protein [Kiritimatiellia bacterium]HNS80347.1 YHS domain-containing protein [Kiritimatiellia bacterium]